MLDHRSVRTREAFGVCKRRVARKPRSCFFRVSTSHFSKCPSLRTNSNKDTMLLPSNSSPRSCKLSGGAHSPHTPQTPSYAENMPDVILIVHFVQCHKAPGLANQRFPPLPFFSSLSLPGVYGAAMPTSRCRGCSPAAAAWSPAPAPNS